jgi:serine/threonine protein kinase
LTNKQTLRELPSHPNVVQVFGVSLDGPQPVIVLEYCAGGIESTNQIKSQIHHKSSFDREETSLIISQI